MSVRRAAGLLILAAVLLATSACATERAAASRLERSALDQARGPEENARLYTDLVRKLIDEERLYAAFAHLQALEQRFGRTGELRLLRADILRKMGRTAEAQTLYQTLSDGPYAGYADHGLGLIYARDDLAKGTRYLQRAVDRLPTNARMRNDLGYALLEAGRLSAARLHLATAYQLDPDSRLSRNNYILLLLIEGNEGRAQRIAGEHGVAPAVVRDLQNQALELSRLATERQPLSLQLGDDDG